MFFGQPQRTPSTKLPRSGSNNGNAAAAASQPKIDNVSVKYFEALSRWEEAARPHQGLPAAEEPEVEQPSRGSKRGRKSMGSSGVEETAAAAARGKKTLKLRSNDASTSVPEMTTTSVAQAAPPTIEPLVLFPLTRSHHWADDDDDGATMVCNRDPTSLSALIKDYHAAPDVSVLAHDELQTVADAELQRQHRRQGGCGDEVTSHSTNEDETSPPTSPDISSASTSGGGGGAASATSCCIDGPRIQRPMSNWNTSLLLDDEEQHQQQQAAATVTTTRTEEKRTDIDQHHHTAHSRNHPPQQRQETPGGGSGLALDTFLRQVLDDVWVATHPSPDFDTEAERVKTLPKVVDQTVKYIGTLLTTGSSSSAPSNNSTIAPFPRFYESSMTKQCNRLMRWLKTWRREHNEGAPFIGGSSDDSDDDENNNNAASNSNVGGISGRGDMAPLTSADFDVLIETSFLFDSRGGRHSARIAKKEAMEKQRAEEEERARQQQRGYFSNDTSTLGGTAVCTAGGEGSMTNMVVISGPTGIGKTAAAYYAAGRMGYRVVEINTSTKRSPKVLEKLIAEATQSRQIQNNGSHNAGRSELEKWKAEAEERARVEAAAAEERARAEAAAAEATRRAQAAEEAEQRIKEEAIEAAAAELARKNSKRAVGVKKENAISKAAIASFFQPRVKSKPPPDAEVLDVDVPPSPPAVIVLAELTPDGDDDDSVSVVPPPPLVLKSMVVEGDEKRENVASRKRSRSEVTATSNSSAAVSSATTPAIVDVDCDSPLSHVKTTTTSPRSLHPQQERLPLIVIESADVFMDDEIPRAFYATIRAMAAESKYPIIVTSNQTFTPQQINSYFGHGTPHAVMEAPAPIYVVAQLAAIVLVELGFVACGENRDSSPAALQEKSTSPISSGPSTRTRPLLCTSPYFQNEAALAQVSKLILTALRSHKTISSTSSNVVGFDGLPAIDIRQCLNQLRYLLLTVKTTHTATTHATAEAAQVAPSSALLPSSPSVLHLRQHPYLRSAIDTVHGSFLHKMEESDCVCFGLMGEDETDDNTTTTATATSDAQLFGSTVARPLFETVERRLSGGTESAGPDYIGSGVATAGRLSDEQVQQLRAAESASKKRQQDLYTASIQPSLAWFSSSNATIAHLDEYVSSSVSQLQQQSQKLTKEASSAMSASSNSSAQQQRQHMCHQVVNMLHRTRSLAAKAYATRSPVAMFDVLHYGGGGGPSNAPRK